MLDALARSGYKPVMFQGQPVAVDYVILNVQADCTSRSPAAR